MRFVQAWQDHKPALFTAQAPKLALVCKFCTADTANSVQGGLQWHLAVIGFVFVESYVTQQIRLRNQKTAASGIEKSTAIGQLFPCDPVRKDPHCMAPDINRVLAADPRGRNLVQCQGVKRDIQQASLAVP